MVVNDLEVVLNVSRHRTYSEKQMKILATTRFLTEETEFG